LRGTLRATVRVMNQPDVYVVGSGPNGLTAAVHLAMAGRRVHVLEAGSTPGGGMRTKELIESGTRHDVCSAIHPLGVISEALRDLPLGEHGLEWVYPEVEVAHVVDGGRAGVLRRSVDMTAEGLGADGNAWRKGLQPLVRAGSALIDDLLTPLRIPRHPVHLLRYGFPGLQPATWWGRRFDTDEGSGLFAGLAAHSILPLSAPITTGYGLMLGMLGHTVGWPMPRGGSQSIADALVSLLAVHGGTVECDSPVVSLGDLPPGATVLLDIAPRQVLELAGERLPGRYAKQLRTYRYGPGVFKLDYVLSGPIPWTNPDAHLAGTVHVGGSFAEVAASEHAVGKGQHPERPFLLVAQPTSFDPTRSSTGRHAAWTYCHVPNGSTVDMTGRIEAQIERFAPGFRDLIVGRHAMATPQIEAYNANYVGGDIAVGAGDLRQFIARPTFGLHPWRTPLEGVYLCSAATPPGAGVHGMCGWHAARTVLGDGR
jgi:phytoene dehydrogenase-like protein